MAVQEMWAVDGWANDPEETGYSFTATVKLPHRMPFAVAQVQLTRSAHYEDFGWNQVYITGFKAGGNPSSVNDAPVVLGIENADSFTCQGDTYAGAITASMVVYCFE